MINFSFKNWFEESKWQTACAILIKDRSALILRRGATAPWMPGSWNLPGGGIDPGETPEQAAKREAKEETGLTASGLVLLDKVTDEELGDMYFFVGRAVGDLQLDYENDSSQWVTIEDLNKYRFVPFVKEALQKALSKVNI